MTQEHSDLLQACKERKYLDIRDRIVAVKMVLVDDCKKSHVAKWFERSRPTIDDWVDRYEKEGIAGLKDRPGRGRKPVISDKMYSYVITRRAVTNPQKVKTEVENRTKQTVLLT